jgi:hypothetical protein
MLWLHMPVVIVTITMMKITDPLNQTCYRSCFNDGDQSTPYNQTVFSQCRPNDRAYYEGFISGCIVGLGIEHFACNQIAK